MKDWLCVEGFLTSDKARALVCFLASWTLLSVSVIIVSLCAGVPAHVYLLIGSILSIIGSLLILISSTTASFKHREKYQFVYALTICALVLALKMFVTAVLVSCGYDIHWQAQHAATCYLLALPEHFAMMGDLGYCFVILLDVSFIIMDPMRHARNTSAIHKRYHIAVWLIAIITCIPPVAAGAIGVGDHGTVYFMGAYDGYLLYFQAAFALFSIINSTYLFFRYAHEHRKQQFDMKAQPQSSRVNLYGNVVQQSLLTFSAFTFAMSWNFAYLVHHQISQTAPHWLNAVQLFWLGGLGFSNTIVWYPFIKRRIMQVGSDIIERITPRRNHVKVKAVRRFPHDGRISSSRSDSVTDSNGDPLPVYRIPARWKEETMCPNNDAV